MRGATETQIPTGFTGAPVSVFCPAASLGNRTQARVSSVEPDQPGLCSRGPTHTRSNPCEPLDVCLVVGEPFASFVAEHHFRRARWITPEEAVNILRAEDERGHVHHAFFEDAMLGRFYAICNCCACCCGAMKAHQSGAPMLAASGYVCQLEPDLCSGCGVCVDFCQFWALSIDDGVARVDVGACMGCGVCLSQCAQGALTLARDPARGEPLELQALLAQAEGPTDSLA